MSWKSGVTIVVAPLLALITQSVLYSMVTPSCSTQTRLELHLSAAVALAIVVVMAVVAYGQSSVRRGEPASHDNDEAHALARARFLANVAAAVAGISALVILGMWFAMWVLGPCMP